MRVAVAERHGERSAESAGCADRAGTERTGDEVVSRRQRNAMGFEGSTKHVTTKCAAEPVSRMTAMANIAGPRGSVRSASNGTRTRPRFTSAALKADSTAKGSPSHETSARAIPPAASATATSISSSKGPVAHDPAALWLNVAYPAQRFVGERRLEHGGEPSLEAAGAQPGRLWTLVRAGPLGLRRNRLLVPPRRKQLTERADVSRRRIGGPVTIE